MSAAHVAGRQNAIYKAQSGSELWSRLDQVKILAAAATGLIQVNSGRLRQISVVYLFCW